MANYYTKSVRLIIRPYQASDYQTWLSAYINRWPKQHKYDEGRLDMSVCTEEWFAAFTGKHQQLINEDKAYVFGVFRLADGMHVGYVDFSTLLRDDFQWARMGYTIHNQFWRMGYGKEAVKAAIGLAFDQLNYHRIEAHINLDNHPSVKLAESVGMEFECLRKGFLYENNEWTDHLVYFINNDHFMA